LSFLESPAQNLPVNTTFAVAAILPGGTSTMSGFRRGIEKERVLALLHIPEFQRKRFSGGLHDVARQSFVTLGEFRA
jgi:hypothetical protein